MSVLNLKVGKTGNLSYPDTFHRNCNVLLTFSLLEFILQIIDLMKFKLNQNFKITILKMKIIINNWTWFLESLLTNEKCFCQ